MSEQTRGGFEGDPATALAVGGTGGCCGNAPQATMTLPDPEASTGAGGSPCCGTSADAQASGSCCGAQAKAEAVTSGAGCCG
jgi:hypothetical protein